MDRLVAKPELAENFTFTTKSRSSVQRPVKRAFGRANSGLLFQEAKLINLHSVPPAFIHLFYGDKSFSGRQRVIIQFTVPIEANMQNIQKIL